LADLDANQKRHPRYCTVAQKAFQLSGNGDAGFRESYQLLALVQARKAKEEFCAE
jgi:hypothetical protein